MNLVSEEATFGKSIFLTAVSSEHSFNLANSNSNTNVLMKPAHHIVFFDIICMELGRLSDKCII